MRITEKALLKGYQYTAQCGDFLSMLGQARVLWHYFGGQEKRENADEIIAWAEGEDITYRVRIDDKCPDEGKYYKALGDYEVWEKQVYKEVYGNERTE